MGLASISNMKSSTGEKAGSSVSSTSNLTGKIVGDRYRILSRLGGDGVVELYEAEQIVLCRRVAFKILFVENGAQIKERFLREARLLSRLDHTGIVHVIEAGFHENLPFLVRDFVDGKSMTQILHDKRRYS